MCWANKLWIKNIKVHKDDSVFWKRLFMEQHNNIYEQIGRLISKMPLSLNNSLEH
jgi:hypothetical protein